jgi:hypothetical protein
MRLHVRQYIFYWNTERYTFTDIDNISKRDTGINLDFLEGKIVALAQDQRTSTSSVALHTTMYNA